MDNTGSTAPAMEHAERGETERPPRGVTLEGLLSRMDALRSDMTDLSDIIAAADGIWARSGDGGGEAAAASVAELFAEREKTCRQQLSFLERIYADHFSASAEAEKTARIKMILDQMNSALSGCHSGGDGAEDGIEPLVRFYGALLEQI